MPLTCKLSLDGICKNVPKSPKSDLPSQLFAAYSSHYIVKFIIIIHQKLSSKLFCIFTILGLSSASDSPRPAPAVISRSSTIRLLASRA